MMVRRSLVALLLLAFTLPACAQKLDPKLFKHASVTVRGTKMHYVSGGQGEPLVLVGGWPESW